MEEIHGVRYSADSASAVKQLIEGIENAIGKTHCFGNLRQQQIKFALNPRLRKDGTLEADKLFMYVRSTKGVAVVVRPRIPYSEPKAMILTKANVAEVVALAKGWFHEVNHPKPKDEHEPMEHKIFVPGGQIESDKSKH